MFGRFGLGAAVGCFVGAIAAISCDANDEPTEVALADAEDAFDEAFCDRLRTCDCDPDSNLSVDECREWVDGRIESLRFLGEGLLYDPSCLGEVIDRLDDRGCGQNPENDDDDDECVAPCHPFHGDRRLGQSCTSVGDGMSDCRQGLVCTFVNCQDEFECSEECVDPCARADAGESCQSTQCRDGLACDWSDNTCRTPPGAGDPCRDTLDCAEGTTCNWDANQCVTRPTAGEPCLFGQCAEDHFCETDPVDPTIQTCRAPADDGEPCRGHAQCKSGNCPAGYCLALPGRGDPCAGPCADGLDCDFETQVCVEAAPAVCSDRPL